MQFKCPYWTNKVKINLLSRWILIHSYLYYELDYSHVDDHVFDNNCRQLADMIERYPQAFNKSRYYYAMHDFDGSTGYGFQERLKSEHWEAIVRDSVMLRDHPPKNPFANSRH